MNPALLNYYQQMQMNQGNQGQEAAMPPVPNQEPYNPFDVGISRAIESARESMGMTQKQQDRAMRNSLLSFAQNMSQQPKEKGFFANFGAAGRAMAPALTAYDQAEDTALTDNNALATQILQQRAQEQARITAEEDKLWQRQMAEQQFGENVRQHNLLDNFRNKSLNSKSKHSAEDQVLYNELDRAENLITKRGNKSYRGIFTRFGNELPKANFDNRDQKALDTLSENIRGLLFKKMGYRNETEFAHVPTVSPNNSPENNLAIIKELKYMLAGHDDSAGTRNIIDDGMAQSQEGVGGAEDVVFMQNKHGQIHKVPLDKKSKAIKNGLTVIEETDNEQ